MSITGYLTGQNVLTPSIRYNVSFNSTEALDFLREYPFEDPRDEPGLCASATDTPLSIAVVINDNTFDSSPATIFVLIVCVNDVPLLDLDVSIPGLGSAFVFIEDSFVHPVFNTSLVSLTDPDSPLFYNATVTLTNRLDIPEYLSFYHSGAGLGYTVYGNNTDRISFYSPDGISSQAVSHTPLTIL